MVLYRASSCFWFKESLVLIVAIIFNKAVPVPAKWILFLEDPTLSPSLQPLPFLPSSKPSGSSSNNPSSQPSGSSSTIPSSQPSSTPSLPQSTPLPSAVSSDTASAAPSVNISPEEVRSNEPNMVLASDLPGFKLQFVFERGMAPSFLSMRTVSAYKTDISEYTGRFLNHAFSMDLASNGIAFSRLELRAIEWSIDKHLRTYRGGRDLSAQEPITVFFEGKVEVTRAPLPSTLDLRASLLCAFLAEKRRNPFVQFLKENDNQTMAYIDRVFVEVVGALRSEDENTTRTKCGYGQNTEIQSHSSLSSFALSAITASTVAVVVAVIIVLATTFRRRHRANTEDISDKSRSNKSTDLTGEVTKEVPSEQGVSSEEFPFDEPAGGARSVFEDWWSRQPQEDQRASLPNITEDGNTSTAAQRHFRGSNASLVQNKQSEEVSIFNHIEQNNPYGTEMNPEKRCRVHGENEVMSTTSPGSLACDSLAYTSSTASSFYFKYPSGSRPEGEQRRPPPHKVISKERDKTSDSGAAGFSTENKI